MPRIDPARNRTYSSWYEMMQRCFDPRVDQYCDYGGRGVTVCDRWKEFQNFVVDMGERPALLTLERIDNDKGYEPGNCRWATRAEQQRNTRRTIRVTVRGRQMCLKDACTSRAHYLAIRRRMRDFGMTFDQAIADRGWA